MHLLAPSLDLARKLSGVDEDTPVRLEGATESLLESLLVGENADGATVRTALKRAAERHGRLLSTVSRAAAPFIGALGPLAEGENTVLTLPFGLTIR